MTYKIPNWALEMFPSGAHRSISNLCFVDFPAILNHNPTSSDGSNWDGMTLNIPTHQPDMDLIQMQQMIMNLKHN